jgi:hypothetical protein
MHRRGYRAILNCASKQVCPSHPHRSVRPPCWTFCPDRQRQHDFASSLPSGCATVLRACCYPQIDGGFHIDGGFQPRRGGSQYPRCASPRFANGPMMRQALKKRQKLAPNCRPCGALAASGAALGLRPGLSTSDQTDQTDQTDRTYRPCRPCGSRHGTAAGC